MSKVTRQSFNKPGECRLIRFETIFSNVLRISPSQALGYIGSDFRYLPGQVKNGIVILLCIFKTIIIGFEFHVTVTRQDIHTSQLLIIQTTNTPIFDMLSKF